MGYMLYWDSSNNKMYSLYCDYIKEENKVGGRKEMIKSIVLSGEYSIEEKGNRKKGMYKKKYFAPGKWRGNRKGSYRKTMDFSFPLEYKKGKYRK